MDETQRAVQRLKHGDIGGLEILFARYQVRAVRAAFLILQDEAAAEDVVQETFLRIYQRIRYFDETQLFEPYLLRSVVHASLNAVRRTNKVIPLDGDLSEIETLLDDSDSPETQLETNQRNQQILSALNKLSPRPGQNFPPPYMTTEQWLELDARGNVIRTLWTDRDKERNVIQQSVTIGNYFMNFTTGESGYNEYSSYPFSTDLLTQDLVQAAQYKAQVAREETPCDDGAPCLLITLFDAFDQPSQHPDEAQPIIGMGRRTWVNQTTGQQVKVQAFTRFQDGSGRGEATDRTLKIEKVDLPPEDVLNIIKGVVVP